MNNRKRTNGRHVQYVRIMPVIERRPSKDITNMNTIEWLKEVFDRKYGNRIGPPRFKRIYH